jgi:hypothetical protein
VSLRDVASLLEEVAVARAEMAPIVPASTLVRRKSGKLTIGEAERIAGVLGRTSKMPGASYGLSAFLCRRGSEMAKVPGSICANCYARSDWYATWRALHVGQGRRHAGLEHPQWVDAMVVLIEHYTTAEVPFFRWHDAGDLQGVWHLANICEVCRRTPRVRHWMPTREYEDVRDYLAGGGVIPPNLTIRLSALMIDAEPPRAVPGIPVAPTDIVIPPELYHLPTSTVHSTAGYTMPLEGRGTLECRAVEQRGNKCGACRACWDQRVGNVSYPEH